MALLTTPYPGSVGKKTARVNALLEQFKGRQLDARYLAYFECFNHQLFFEAHDVLEDLWLTERDGPNYSFYKGLIQLTGAFVHLQKQRPGPATALFSLAKQNLLKYPSVYQQLDLTTALKLIEEWVRKIECHAPDPLAHALPTLQLLSEID